MASLIYGIRMRLARKPGESADTDEILPIRSTNATAVSMVSWEVCRPAIISTPFWMGTGFMKCVEITRDGACKSVGFVVVAAAILVIEMDEVLVARMAFLEAICASWEKMEVLRSTISGTASITKSTEERSSIFRLGVMRERTLSAASRVIRSLEISFSRSLSVRRRCVIQHCTYLWSIGRFIVTGKFKALIQRCLGVIDQRHRNSSFLGSHQSNTQSLEVLSETH